MSRSAWLRLLIAMIAVLVVCELGVRVLMRDAPAVSEWYTPVADAKVEILSEAGAPSVAFVGSSMTFHGVRAERLCAGDPANVFNAALPAAFPRVSEEWLDDVVLTGGNRPDVLVWGLSPIDVSGLALERETVDSYLDSRGGGNSWLDAVDRWASDRFAIVDHRLALRDLGELEAALDGDPPVLQSLECGSRPQYRERQQGPIERAFLVDPESEAALRRGIRAATTAGVEVRLLLVPLRGGYEGVLGEEGLADFESFLAGLVDDFGVSVVRPSGDYAPDLFTDNTHLGPEGAHRFTEEVATHLGLQYEAGGLLDVVTVDDGGAPVVGLDVVEVRAGQVSARYSTSEGTIRLPVEPGESRLCLALDQTVCTATASLVAGQTVELDLVVPPALSEPAILDLEVTDGTSGRSLAGVVVRVNSLAVDAAEWRVVGRTDGSGRLSTPVPAGSTRIRLDTPTGTHLRRFVGGRARVSTAEIVELTAGESLELEIALDPA